MTPFTNHRPKLKIKIRHPMFDRLTLPEIVMLIVAVVVMAAGMRWLP
jgi:hypothetical protein